MIVIDVSSDDITVFRNLDGKSYVLGDKQRLSVLEDGANFVTLEDEGEEPLGGGGIGGMFHACG